MSAEYKPSVFLRQASGLKRNVSLLDAVSINLSDMGGVQVLAIVGFTTVLLPSMIGVNLLVANLIAFLMTVPQIIIYSIMTQRMARTGGDYIWISRTFGSFIGSVVTLAGWTLADVPFVSFTCLSAVMSIGSVAVALGYWDFIALAYPPNVEGANPMLQLVVGVVILAVLVTLGVLKPRLGYKTISVLTIVALFGSAVGILALLYSGTAGVVNYIDSLAIPDTTYATIANSYSGPIVDIGATLMVVPFFISSCYAYVNAGAAVGSEIKGKSALKWNVPIAATFQFLMVTACLGAMYYAGGSNFVAAAYGNVELVYYYSFNFFTLAMGVSNSIVAWIIGLGWIAWLIAITMYGLVVIPRYFMAQSFDRYLPAVIAHVSPRYNSPTVAMLIVFVISAVFIGTATLIYGTIMSLYGIWVSIMVYFVVVGIAAAVYGARKEKGGTRTVLIICGIIMAVAQLSVVYAYLAFPNIWGGNAIAYGYDVAIAVLAILIYAVSKRYYMNRGIDISQSFKEIPPL
jgi:amino acid transporter